MARNFFLCGEFEWRSSNMDVFNQKKNMRGCKTILAGFGAGLLLTFHVGAQITNAPATILENFEQQTGTVIVKGFSVVGSVAVGTATITVRCKESSAVGHGQKACGIAVGFSGSGSLPGNFIPKTSLKVDDDELDSLAGGIDYLGKITYDVTPLAGFEASYTTKSGLRVIAHSDRRQGGINTFIQFGDSPRIPLNSDQMTQLRNLVKQAKTSLDAVK
jgi:hypothetical protein